MRFSFQPNQPFKQSTLLHIDQVLRWEQYAPIAEAIEAVSTDIRKYRDYLDNVLEHHPRLFSALKNKIHVTALKNKIDVTEANLQIIDTQLKAATIAALENDIAVMEANVQILEAKLKAAMEAAERKKGNAT